METLLAQWEQDGVTSPCFDRLPDVAQMLIANYVLLRDNEELSLCEGLTKPPVSPIGDFLPPRALHELPENSICLFGAPFDTACVPPYSPAHGPTVIRQAYLRQLSETHDKRTQTKDLGDVLKWPEDGLSKAGKRIEHLVRLILGASAFPIMLGGDHSTTYFALKALSENANEFALLHLDAHADIAPSGDPAPLNHANVISHCMTLTGLRHVTQIGLRRRISGGRPASVAGKSLTVSEYRQTGVEALIGTLPRVPIYLTLDMDVLDPQVASEVTTPLEDGLSFEELTALISAVAEHCTLIGADLVEVCATGNAENRAAGHAADILTLLAQKMGNRWRN